jgi:hypothetical protein
MEGTGERAFLSRENTGLTAYIVLNSITKHELNEFKSSVTVIYQNYEIPFLILKYKTMSYDMPLISSPGANSYTNSLTIYIIDLNGYILKDIRLLGLEDKLAKSIQSGYDSISSKSVEEIIYKVQTSIYPKYSYKDMLKGGTRHHFPRT